MTTTRPDTQIQPGDTARFREAMAALAATACVVTTREGEVRLGRTVTAAFSMSVEPPAVLVSIDAGSALASAMRARRGFTLAMPSQEQGPVADAFAGKAPSESRFDHGDWGEWTSGHPRLAGAVASLDCSVGNAIEVAGHILFVGIVREVDLDPARRPLVWHGRRYNAVAPL